MPALKGSIKSPLGKTNGSHVGTQLPLNRPAGKEPPRMAVSGRVTKMVSHVSGLKMTRGKRSAAARGINGKARR